MLAAGRDALTLFDQPTLAAKGVPAAVRAHPNFVPAAYMVHGAQYFDAAFFGISPHEARRTRTRTLTLTLTRTRTRTRTLTLT